MRALVATNHLAEFAGSEIVAVEVAETLRALGCEVELFANYVHNPMKEELEALGLRATDQPPFPNPFEYDLVWSQHHIVSLLLSERALPESSSTFFVFAHLSPFEPLETPGIVLEETLADRVLANSPETRSRLIELGIDEGLITVFHNAAPSAFVQDIHTSRDLRRLLLVSNHLPEEVKEASNLARESYGIEVRHIGRQGKVQRVTPEDIRQADAVVTIGKTVQYAILAGRPVYCYDQFGGPGWLVPSNLDAAESFNFSGRCCNRKIDAAEICNEWIEGYAEAGSSATDLKSSRQHKYVLESYLSGILELADAKRSPGSPTSFSEVSKQRSLRQREGQMAAAIRRHYRSERITAGKVRALESKLRSRNAEVRNLTSRCEAQEARAADLTAKLTDLATRLESRDAEISGLTSKLKVQEARAADLRAQLKAQERYIDGLKASTSWRVTAPLRAVSSGLKRSLRHMRHAPVLARQQGRLQLGRAANAFFRYRSRHPELARILIDPLDHALGSKRLDESRPKGAQPGDRPGVTVVVPVFNALDETCRCIESALRTIAPQDRLLIVDDCSSDDRIVPRLRAYRDAHECVRLIENPRNFGYTRTINRAAKAVRSDIVLLNSDTIVTPLWLDLLYASAYSRPEIGTVTAVSNNAGAFSLPDINQENEIPEGFTVNAFAEFVRDLAGRELPEAPTGNGFCMYIKRAVFDHIGFFDETRFPRGYGEENDFCLRAKSAGFTSVIDDGVYIYHKRSASFGTERYALIETSRRTLASLHPGYKAQVNAFLSNHPLADVSARIGSALLAHLHHTRTEARPSGAGDRPISLPVSGAAGQRPAILFVIHNGSGGSRLTNRDLMDALRPGFRCYLLLCDKAEWTLVDVESGTNLERWDFKADWRIEDQPDDERLCALRAMLARYRIEIAHLRSMICLAPELLQTFTQHGARTVLSFHDFYAICPTIQLIDNRGRYCGGQCSATSGSCRMSPTWFVSPPPMKNAYVYRWRERVRHGLRVCDAFVTTSFSAREAITTYYPSVLDRLHIIEHGRDGGDMAWVGAPPADRAVRIVCIGALNIAKGAQLLKALFDLNAERIRGAPGERNFEFHVFGPVDNRLRADWPGVILHGEYERENLRDRVAEVSPSFSLITSIWPETYCHTLTESWHFGLPVFASDIGTLKERIERHGGGWLLDHSDADLWYRRMLDIVADSTSYAERLAEIRQIQFRTVAQMAADYAALYRNLLMDASGVSGPTAVAVRTEA